MFRSARAQNGKLVLLVLLLLRSKDLYCLGGGGGELGCFERIKEFKNTIIRFVSFLKVCIYIVFIFSAFVYAYVYANV